MGNFAGKVSGLVLNNSPLLVDQLHSSGELMIRIPQAALQRIHGDQESMFLVAMLTDILFELDAKDMNKQRQVKTQQQATSVGLGEFETFIPRVSAERLNLRAQQASIANPQFDEKILSQTIRHIESILDKDEGRIISARRMHHQPIHLSVTQHQPDQSSRQKTPSHSNSECRISTSRNKAPTQSSGKQSTTPGRQFTLRLKEETGLSETQRQLEDSGRLRRVKDENHYLNHVPHQVGHINLGGGSTRRGNSEGDELGDVTTRSINQPLTSRAEGREFHIIQRPPSPNIIKPLFSQPELTLAQSSSRGLGRDKGNIVQIVPMSTRPGQPTADKENIFNQQETKRESIDINTSFKTRFEQLSVKDQQVDRPIGPGSFSRREFEQKYRPIERFTDSEPENLEDEEDRAKTPLESREGEMTLGYTPSCDRTAYPPEARKSQNQSFKYFQRGYVEHDEW
jgi:hypothetical protein